MKSSPLLKILAAACVVVVTALLILRIFFVEYSYIPQDGMSPGKPAGSLILGWRRPYGSAKDVKRGDIVYFVRSQNQIPYKFVWRVMGLPGDQIEVENYVVSINGAVLKTEFRREGGGMKIFQETNGAESYEVAYPKDVKIGAPPPIKLTIPDNSFFVMGDNRYNAQDSRFYGPIKFESIVAKAIY